jgi:hypothetical protein
MNKREFVAGGVAAVVAAPALAQSADGGAARAPLHGLLTRTHRLPDLVERAGADAFDAYVGERFAVVAGAGAGEQLVVKAVRRVARCAATEQFDVAFEALGTPAAGDGVRLLAHATGQRLALHLERGQRGYTARFNLLA